MDEATGTVRWYDAEIFLESSGRGGCPEPRLHHRSPHVRRRRKALIVALLDELIPPGIPTYESTSTRECHVHSRRPGVFRRALRRDGGRGQAERPHVHAARRLRDRAGRRAAAGRSADRRRLRRAGPALRRRLVRLERHRSRSSSTSGRTASCGSRTPTATAGSTSSTVFADKMMFPEGALWHDGSLYVAAPPSIWKLTDTDGDGVADQRERVVPGQDAHRLRQRPARPVPRPRRLDLLVQGGVRRADLRAARPARRSSPGRRTSSGAGPTARGIEPVMTGGMDNPVDVVFTPGGERIFTTTFLQHPGGGQRDGLIHAVYGGVYGKDHDVLDGHPRTGPTLMPVLAHLGPAAPCGLAPLRVGRLRRRSTSDNLFAALFNLHKVTRHVLDAGRGDVHDARRGLPRLRQPRLPSDRRARGRRRQPARRRHRRLVQALLPDVAARQAGRARGDLPRPPQGGAAGRRPARAEAGVGRR